MFQNHTNDRLQSPRPGFIRTAASIISKETFFALYKGLGAVVTGIVPKMAIRFSSFEAYKGLLTNKNTGTVSTMATFLGKLQSLEYVFAWGIPNVQSIVYNECAKFNQ